VDLGPASRLDEPELASWSSRARNDLEGIARRGLIGGHLDVRGDPATAGAFDDLVDPRTDPRRALRGDLLDVLSPFLIVGRIREEVERNLSDEYHLSADQISSCFEYATEDWPFNLAEVLAQAK